MTARKDFRLAAQALARMIWEDNPHGMTLAQIVSTWSRATAEEVAALERIQHLLPQSDE